MYMYDRLELHFPGHVLCCDVVTAGWAESRWIKYENLQRRLTMQIFCAHQILHGELTLEFRRCCNEHTHMGTSIYGQSLDIRIFLNIIAKCDISCVRNYIDEKWKKPDWGRSSGPPGPLVRGWIPWWEVHGVPIIRRISHRSVTAVIGSSQESIPEYSQNICVNKLHTLLDVLTECHGNSDWSSKNVHRMSLFAIILKTRTRLQVQARLGRH